MLFLILLKILIIIIKHLSVCSQISIDKKYEEEEYFPMTVYSLLTPTMSLKFLNHIMLSFERYATEFDLSLHGSTRE